MKLTLSLLMLMYVCIPKLHAADKKAGPSNEFFAFDNGVGIKNWSVEKQATVLKKLGYDGIGLHYFDNLPERLEIFKKHGVKVYNVYVGINVDKDKTCPTKLKTMIKQFKGTGTDLWLYVQGKNKASEENAVKLITEIADLAKESGLKVAIYPHHGFYVATAKDALRLFKKVNRKNVGLTFNLCHELRAGNEKDFDAIIKEIAPHMIMASINGADSKGGWDKLIQPLDKGSIDVSTLIKKLNAAGYKGPIGLQSYNVKGDQEENLKRAIEAWRNF